MSRIATVARALGHVAVPRCLPVPMAIPGAIRAFSGVTIDKTCRVYSCKVKDDEQAHQLDLLMDEFIENVETLDGYAGAARLVCKSEWDYKLIIKFQDLDSLKDFMANHHPAITKEYNPRIEQLVNNKVHEQNFVYDDIE